MLQHLSLADLFAVVALASIARRLYPSSFSPADTLGMSRAQRASACTESSIGR